MKNFILLMMLFVANSMNASMITDNAWKFLANAAYHTNDFQGAQVHYSKILEKNPYDPETNYNLGLTSLKQMKHDTALNYFTRAAKHAQKNSQLQEQAFFNQGNTLVGLNKLQESLKSYQQVLAINQKNDRAKQNIEVVKKMLEQKKEQNNDQNKNDDQNKDSDSKDQKSDKKNEKSNNDDSKDQDSKDQNSDKLDDKKEQEKTKQEKEKEEQNQKDRDQKDQNSDQNKTKEQSADQLEKSKQQKEKQDDSLKKSQEKKDDPKNDTLKEEESTQEESLNDELAELVNPDDKDDRLNKTSASLMQKMKDHEDHIQKQLLKMNVSKHGAAKHGQKNW
ncbi:MAG: hypothetical protein NTU89_02720 [Candidatus Dependentiae bacterium]|nr:hypothetical protein [Candidatus Dependentiae bacterium]